MVARTGRGYDAGKKINGRELHIAFDTGGMPLTVLVTAASIQGPRPRLTPLQRWSTTRSLATAVIGSDV